MKNFILALLAAGAIAVSAAARAGSPQTVILNVQGMDCAACPITVRQVLKKVDGVSDASVDFKRHAATVTFDPEKTRPAQLAKVVTDIGFPASVAK